MRLNKKKIISFLIILFLFFTIFSLGQISWAESFEDLSGLKDAGTEVGYADKETSSIARIVGNVIGAVLALIGVAFMFMILFGAFDIAGSAGNEEEIKKGKGRIKDGAIGILIIFSAYILARVVLTLVSGSSESPVFKIGNF